MPNVVGQSMLEINVLGSCSGQNAHSILHYWVGNPAGGNITLDEVLEEFATLWRLAVLPLVTTQYNVVSYRARNIAGITGLTPSSVEWVYGSEDFLAGGAGDFGLAAPPTLPTYVAATVRKLTSGGADTDYYPIPPTIPPVERRFRGSLRIAGIPEGSTQSGDPNLLDGGVITGATPALQDLVNIIVAPPSTFTVTLDMLVASMTAGGVTRTGAAGAPTAGYQFVDNLVINPYVGSQLSRKYTGPS